MLRSPIVVVSILSSFACVGADPKPADFVDDPQSDDEDGADEGEPAGSYNHDEGDGDGDGDGDGEQPACAQNDDWETNDIPASATLIPWDYSNESHSAWTIHAFLCAEEYDWYLVPVEALNYDFYGLFIRATVDGSGWCGPDCDDPFLPPAPENTIAIDVFDAETKMLLTGSISDKGRLYINTSGDAYSHDLLVRVSGPTPAATYGYQLNVEIRGFDGEDECEC